MKDTTDTTEKKKKAKDLFAETKIRMMMEIYKVSRTKAIKMIAERAAEKAVAQENDRTETADGRTIRQECLPIDAIRILLLPVAKKYGLRRVFLFGSYARGEAKPESDIDLLIEEGDLGTAAKFMDLVDTLETRLGKPVDIVTANKAYSDSSRAGKRLLRNIERDKVLVYEGA